MSIERMIPDGMGGFRADTPVFRMTDQEAARQLRDRIAREIAEAFIGDEKTDGQITTSLTPVYRWLNDIVEPKETMSRRDLTPYRAASSPLSPHPLPR